MREETRQVIVEQTVFVANDGKEFDDEDDCKAYEVNCSAKNLEMYNYSNVKTDNIDNCWYVKLSTTSDITTFIEFCKYEGVSHRGIDAPGVYMYTEGNYGGGNYAWTDISKIVERFAGREDKISGN